MFFEHAEGVVLNHVIVKTDDNAKASVRGKDMQDMFIYNNKPKSGFSAISFF